MTDSADPPLPPDRTIERILSGECTPDEEASLTPEQRLVLQELRATLRGPVAMRPQVDTAALFRDLTERIQADEGNRQQALRHLSLLPRSNSDARRAEPPPHWPSAARHVSSVAMHRAGAVVAACTLVAILTWGLWRGHTRQLASVGHSSMHMVSARRGEQIQVRLPDGSVVVLRPDSRLAYDTTTFTDGARDVSLAGEAVFTVAHDPRRRFAVHAAGAVATDLGTRFVVAAYPDVPLQVAVASGSVSLTPRLGSAPTVLTPGLVARRDADGALVVGTADTVQFFGWTTGALVFHDAPLREIVAQLSRTYDIDVQVGDPTQGAVPLNLALRNEPAVVAVQLVASVAHAHVERRGRVVLLVRGPAATPLQPISVR